MPDQTKSVLPWYESLADGVMALWEACREYEVALHGIKTLSAGVEYGRRRPVDGRVLDAGRWSGRSRPHDTALGQLTQLYSDAARRIENLHRDAALAYVFATAAAVRAVQAGECPGLPTVTNDGTGPTGTLAVGDLDRYAHATKVTSARTHLDRLLYAADAAEDLADREYLADHEAGQLHALLDEAAGIPGAAYAYGLVLQDALRWAVTMRRQAGTLNPQPQPGDGAAEASGDGD
jgi:hypothetical protein